MSELSELQHQFKQYLLQGDTSVLSRIETPGEDSAEQRLQVYGDMYVMRLQEAVSEDYSLLAHLIGDMDFTRLTLDYVKAYPSHHYSLRYFSQFLAEYLTQAEAYKDNTLYYEVAQFEWASHNVIDAEDAPVLKLEDLQAIEQEKWPELQFGFHPSLQKLSLYWNVHDLKYNYDNEQIMPEPSRLDQPLFHILWRKEITPFHDIYSDTEAWMLNAADEQQTFADICEGLCQFMAEEEVASFAINQIVRWLNQGFVSTLGV